MTDRYLYGKQVTAQTIAKLVSRGATDKFRLLSAIVKTLPQGCKMPVVGTVANWARRACDEGAIAIDRIGTPAGKRAICDDDRIARLVYRPIGSDEPRKVAVAGNVVSGVSYCKYGQTVSQVDMWQMIRDGATTSRKLIDAINAQLPEHFKRLNQIDGWMVRMEDDGIIVRDDGRYPRNAFRLLVPTKLGPVTGRKVEPTKEDMDRVESVVVLWSVPRIFGHVPPKHVVRRNSIMEIAI